MALSSRSLLLILIIAIILFASHADAFGAGNIASISAVEGRNWRHGDIEDLLKQVTCIKHHKWNSMMIKRVYFGNWLRDYSQAMDTGALKKAQPETIRIMVWLLSFLGFGYATAEFEVTSERLGVYRPEEHIDNPKNYNDDEDARPYDPRLRGPVRPIELEVDLQTGMKNYIANGRGDWATSAAFVKYSFERSIHFGRMYTSSSGFLSKGKDEDLAEACRLLGQGLHTLEDFGAHTNYIELALIEMGFRNVFPLVGTNTAINLRGKHVYPLVTGTFGMVDFYHSVLGEATDHFTQSEINEMDNAMGMAESAASSSNPLGTLVKLLSKVPGTKDLCDEAQKLHASSQAAAASNRRGVDDWQGGSRGVDDYSSSRGIDDYSSTRAGPGDYPGAGHHGAASHDWNAPQQSGYGHQAGGGWDSYSQPPQQQSWNQPPQQSWDHQPQQQWNQPPPQQWNQSPPPQPQYHETGGQGSYGQPSWQQQPPPPQHQGSYQSDWQQQQHQQPPHPQSGNFPPQQSATVAGAGPGKPPKPQGLEGMPDFDPGKTVKQIYPILVFRDKVVRSLSAIIEKIPGLEALVERIVETLTVFIFSLLAPFVRPVLKALNKTLESGSAGVTESNGRHQYEVWTDSNCSDPTHSMLSKDHFSNILNEPAGNVAGEILKFIAPRVLYAWEHPEVPVDRVMADIDSIFHHPAVRDERNECHRNMFGAVRRWVDSRSDRGHGLEAVLNAEAVRAGKNHKAGVNDHAGHGSSMGPHGAGYHQSAAYGGGSSGQQGGFGGYLHSAENIVGGLTGHPQSGQHHGSTGGQGGGGIGGVFQQAQSFLGGPGQTSHHKPSSGGAGGGLNDMFSLASNLPGVGKYTSQFNQFNKYSSMLGGGKRGLDDEPGSNRGTPGGLEPPGGARNTRGIDDDGDYGDSDKYANLGFASVGGGDEFYDAARHGSGDARTPSPGPMSPPSGYETYGSGEQHQHGGYEASQSYGGGQYQQQQQQQYGGGGGGYDYFGGGGGGGAAGGQQPSGASDSYYR